MVPFGSCERFQIRDDGGEVFFSNPVLKGRHDRRVTGHNLLVGKENRVAEILIVDDDHRLIGKRNRFAVESLEPGRGNFGVVSVTAAAAQRVKRALTLRRERERRIPLRESTSNSL